jgi:hypothetical protein
VQTAASSYTGPPSTENPIKKIAGNGFLNRVVLYESGAAKFEFRDDYGCYERIAVGDHPSLRGDNLRAWDLPTDGELIVDMRAAVSNTTDPSNEFWVRSLGSEDSYCASMSEISMSFTAPDGWID